jgi:CBS domain-containing protein
VMTKDPLRIQAGAMMVDAVAVLAARKISELPVTDADGKPVGLIDITDVVALLPKDTATKEPQRTGPTTLRVVGEPDGETETRS